MRKIMSAVLIAALTLSMTLTGCGKKGEQPKEDTKQSKEETSTAADGTKNKTKVVLTVGKEKIFMDEMMYYIFMQEYQLMQTEQMYLAYTGQSYLDSEYSEGVTMRDMAKTSIMDAATLYQVLYQEALKDGYKLTEDETKEIETSTESFMNAITEDQLKLTGLSKETVSKVLEKLSIGYRYMEDTIKKLNIDETEVTKDIKKEDYRQYNTENLFVATSKTDDTGNSTEFTAKEKKAAKAKLDAVLAKAKTDEFAKIVESDKEITTQTSNFVPGKNQTSEEYEAAAIKLDNKAVSDVIETKEGYYIIKMLDNNSDESYKKACDDAVTAEEQKQFAAEYDKLKENYKVDISKKEWDPIVMGKTTIVETPAASDKTAADGADDAAKDTSDDTEKTK